MGDHNSPQGAWRKSSLCDNGQSCVEVSLRDGEVCVRDSKSPLQEMHFSVPEWVAFTAGVIRGEFDPSHLAGLPNQVDNGNVQSNLAKVWGELL